MSETQTTQIEAPQPAASGQEPPMVFFGIGLVINLVLISAFFVWAFKQGKKRKRQDD